MGGVILFPKSPWAWLAKPPWVWLAKPPWVWFFPWPLGFGWMRSPIYSLYLRVLFFLSLFGFGFFPFSWRKKDFFMLMYVCFSFHGFVFVYFVSLSSSFVCMGVCCFDRPPSLEVFVWHFFFSLFFPPSLVVGLLKSFFSFLSPGISVFFLLLFMWGLPFSLFAVFRDLFRPLLFWSFSWWVIFCPFHLRYPCS